MTHTNSTNMYCSLVTFHMLSLGPKELLLDQRIAFVRDLQKSSANLKAARP